MRKSRPSPRRASAAVSAAVHGPAAGPRSVMEQLEHRQLFAAAGVDADLHRPPRVLFAWGGLKTVPDVVIAYHSRSSDGKPVVSVDRMAVDPAGDLKLARHFEFADPDPDAVISIATGDLVSPPGPNASPVDIDVADGHADIAVKLFSVTAEVQPTGDRSHLSRVMVLAGDGKGGLEQRKTFVIPHVLEKSGDINGRAAKRTIIMPHVLETSGIAVGDVNGDSTDDLVDWVGDDVVTLASVKGGPRQTVSQRKGWDGTIKGSSRIVGTGDLDGDGQSDLIAFDEDGATVRVSAFDNGKGFVRDGRIDVPGRKTDGKIENVAVGDLNGDGLDDLVVATKKGILVGLNRRGSTVAGIEVQSFSWGATQPGQKFAAEDVLVGDLNGDGVDEILEVTIKGNGKPRQYTGHVTLNR